MIAIVFQRIKCLNYLSNSKSILLTLTISLSQGFSDWNAESQVALSNFDLGADSFLFFLKLLPKTDMLPRSNMCSVV